MQGSNAQFIERQTPAWTNEYGGAWLVAMFTVAAQLVTHSATAKAPSAEVANVKYVVLSLFPNSKRHSVVTCRHLARLNAEFFVAYTRYESIRRISGSTIIDQQAA